MEFFTTTIYLILASLATTLTIFQILELQARIQRRGQPDPARALVLWGLILAATILWTAAFITIR